MSDFLLRMRAGLTFEEARRGYAESVGRLAAQRLGRQTASRVSDADAYWSPTAELIEEAMRFGFVQHRALPSARIHVAAHRDIRYELTALGYEAAEGVATAPASFRLMLADAAIAAHPYMRAFLQLLEAGPLVCPEIREGEIENGRRDHRDTLSWAHWAAKRITARASDETEVVDVVRAEMHQAATRRFGRDMASRPTNKALAEALNDAFAVASLKWRGTSIGATDLKVLKAWGSQLLLLDQSRYVPDYSNSNVIWLASDLSHGENSKIVARPRTFVDHGAAIAREVVDTYKRQAQGRVTELITMPYLPIHDVRAEAAFRCGVTRQLVDIVLERLARGDFKELGVQVWLHLSGGEVPGSEPVYRRGGTRRFSMTVTTDLKEAQ